jgi:hypothetical protein
MEKFLLLFGWLIPPLNPTGNELLKWRVTVGVVAMANSVAIGCTVALALGAVPLLFPGFVKNTELTELKTQISSKAQQQDGKLQLLQVNQMDSKILDIRSRQCGAEKAREKAIAAGQDTSFNQGVLSFTTERLYELLRDYYSLTGAQYRLPKCEEL